VTASGLKSSYNTAIVRHILCGRVLVFTLVLAGAGPVDGHHSFAAIYNEKESLTIEGDVAEFANRAPHSWLYVMVPDASGRPQRYAAEWRSPSQLKAAGVDAAALQPGDRVSVTGSPARNPAARQIRLKAVTRVSRGGWSWP
jgi:hypothetical protein